MRLALPFVTSTKRKRKPGPWDADWEKAQVKFARVVQRALGRMEKDVWAKVQKRTKGSKAFPDDPGFWGKEKDAFLGATGGEVDSLLLEGVTQAESLGLGVNFDLVNKQVLKYSRTFSNEWWGRLEKTTREGLRRAITTNIETGAPLSALRKNITPLFGAQRAEMIASTEVTHLFAEGNKIAYRDAGVAELEWRTVGDDRVCPECEERDGKRYPINDPGATPPLHVRCRCWIAPIVDKRALLTPIPTVANDASFLRAAAMASDKGVTGSLKGIAKGSKGRLANLQFRLKSQASLERKLANYRMRGYSPASAKNRVNDALRYTIEIPEEQYTVGVKSALADLEAEGYKVTRLRNTWNQPDYKGINTVVTSPEGQRLELQFHTPESLIVKEDMAHPLYEKIRAMPAGPERLALELQQEELWAGVRIPQGVRGIRKIR